MKGCNLSKNLYIMEIFLQVIGKASVLDEIINYIQALQHQVEVEMFAALPCVLVNNIFFQF